MIALRNGVKLQNGKYEIVRFINSGGFGCTYEAHHTQMNSRVAIKEFFVKNYCDRDEASSRVNVPTSGNRELVERLKEKFHEEAKSVNGMRHLNIVRVTDTFEENGTAYYVMEYIDGKSLEELVRERGHLTESEALGYVLQVADALEYVHDCGRLHLDVKPGNIMIGAGGKAILIDFGASKLYDPDTGENFSSLMGVNTPGYAPIEQVDSEFTQFNPPADIYALGATLYKLMTGVTPPRAVSLVNGTSVLKPLPKNISDSTRAAVMAAMSHKRENRPQTIAEFRKMLNGGKKRKPLGLFIGLFVGIILSVALFFLIKNGGVGDAPIIGNDSIVNNPAVSEDSVGKDTIKVIDPVERKEREDKKTGRPQVIEQSDVKVKVRQEPDPEPVSVPVTKPTTGHVNGREWVDLGLSVKWATCNVGANSPEDSGNYFAWGAIDAMNRDNSGDIVSDYNDVATARWRGSWRVPTKKEFQELIDKCDWEWAGNGCRVTSKINGNSIFLPAAGWKKDSSSGKENVYGYYWSSSADWRNDGNACYLYFLDGNRGVDKITRSYGHSIRPVCD